MRQFNVDHSFVEYVGTCANILRRRECFSGNDLSILSRILKDLRSYNAHAVGNNSQKTPDAVELILQRQGLQAFTSNLLRFSLREPLNRFRSSLAQFGMSLLRCAERSFNRPFHAVKEDGTDAPLYGAVVIGLVNQFATISHQLQDIQLNCKNYVIGNAAILSEEFFSIETELSEALGFTNHSSAVFAGVANHRMITTLRELISDLALNLLVFVNTVESNLLSQKASDVRDFCDNIQACASRINSANHDLLRFNEELCRSALCQVLTEVSQLMSTESPKLLELIEQHQNLSQTADTFALRGFFQKLKYALAQAGHSFNVAEQAANDLRSFLGTKKISPNELIQAEVAAISPALSFEHIQTALSTYESEKKNFAVVPLIYKENTFANLKSLEIAFAMGLADV